MDDSNPDAARAVGESVARSLGKKIDAAFFIGTGVGEEPAGLGTVAGVQSVAAGTAWTNADPFTEGAVLVEAEGGTVGAWVANPADVMALSTIKAGTGSNAPLLAPDANSATRCALAGVPLHLSPSAHAGTVYGVDPAFTFTVLRNAVEVDRDDSVFFNSYSSALRGVARVAFAFTNPASVVKVTITPAA